MGAVDSLCFRALVDDTIDVGFIVDNELAQLDIGGGCTIEQGLEVSNHVNSYNFDYSNNTMQLNHYQIYFLFEILILLDFAQDNFLN